MSIVRKLPKIDASSIPPLVEEEARALSIRRGITYMESLSIILNGCGELPPNTDSSLTHGTISSTSVIRSETVQVTLTPAQSSLSRWMVSR